MCFRYERGGPGDFCWAEASTTLESEGVLEFGSGGGFVEDEDFGVVEEGLGEAGAVAVAFGEGVDGLAGDALQEAGFDGAVDGVGFGGAGEAAHVGTEAEEAADGHAVVERGGFGEVADFLFRLGGLVDHGDAADVDFALGGREEAGDDPHGGRFSGAVGSQESEDLAFVYREGEVVDRLLVSELLCETGDLNHGW